MKKIFYKNLEDITIFFNEKVWRSLHKYGIGGIENTPEANFYDGITIIENKLFLRFKDGAEDISVLNSSWNEEQQVWFHCVPRKIWTKRLESFGFIHK